MSSNTSAAVERVCFWGTHWDKDYLPRLKPCMGSVTTFVQMKNPSTLAEVVMFCKSKAITQVATNNLELLKKLLNWTERKAPSINNYLGSYFRQQGIEFVIIPPLAHLVTVPRAKFMITRIVSKLTNPGKWFKATDFNWDVLTHKNCHEVFERYKKAMAIAVDTETFRENATIRCISYTAFFKEADGSLSSHTCVFPINTEWGLLWMRKFNWELKAGKILQNGKYDAAYLARYNAPMYNYLYDTANLFHSWYAELPKDLGFLNAFFIREAMYHKDLANTNDLMEYYKYNALDTWSTGNCFLAMLLECPKWAYQNYLKEFPLVYPSHMCEMTGFKRDMDKLKIARAEAEKIIQDKSAQLNTMLGVTDFNVKSPPQMKKLLKLLGCGDLKKADETSLNKARYRHPLNFRIINLVLEIREARTRKEKYLQVGEDAKEFNGRILCALNPHGTDTSRNAAKEHHFWCGIQMQNIPARKGKQVKQTFVADDDFYLAEVDLEQAESRDTGYISGDEQLIYNVEESPDFHSANASSFFGVVFEEIFDAATKTVLNKALRTLAKPVNHGANYNMGWAVLVDTMGEQAMIKAKHLLKLPRFWGLRQIAEHLLEQFHKTYPSLREVYYPEVIKEVLTTNMITSKAIHHTDLPVVALTETEEQFWHWYEYVGGAWTRYCFKDPSKNKPALNAYIAHPPQSLNAQTLNKAFLRTFQQIAMHPEHSKNFKLIMQVHDSIIFQYRKGHEYFCEMVERLMEIPVTVLGYDGKVRTFVVPASAKKGIDGKPALYWSETE